MPRESGDLKLRLETSAPTETPGVTDMRAFEDDVKHPTIHMYPARWPYRRSGADVPQVGDVALCGVIKTTPYTGKYTNRDQNCERCLMLGRLGV